MTKVGELSAQVQAIIDNISALTISITNSYNNLNTRATSGPLTNDINTQSQIDNLEQKADAADREFEEAKYKYHGRKSRKQTLQEFLSSSDSPLPCLRLAATLGISVWLGLTETVYFS
jgi:flagellar biosynthesis chaperone FliJ